MADNYQTLYIPDKMLLSQLFPCYRQQKMQNVDQHCEITAVPWVQII